MCGKKLDLLGSEVNAKLVGSPLMKSGSPIRVTQGEIFEVTDYTLPAKFHKPRGRGSPAFVLIDQNFASGDVYIKVWSPAVHRCIQYPLEYFAAISELVSRSSSDASAAVALQGLAKVLVAVIRPSQGHTITIMKKIEVGRVSVSDLPKAIRSDVVKPFFTAFREQIVEKILLPMANLGYVHRDLRPGYSEVHNIVIDKRTDEMVLIDFESICDVNAVYNSTYTDKTAPLIAGNGPAPIESPLVWVSLQCIGIVYAWNCQVELDDFHRDIARKWFTDMFPSVDLANVTNVLNSLHSALASET